MMQHENANPFSNPELLHPELAADIANVEAWQVEHDPSAQIAATGIATVVQEAVAEHTQENPLEKVSPEFSDAVELARDKLELLFRDTSGFPPKVPELDDSELEYIDWEALEQGYKTFEQLGMQPEVVITPEGKDLNFWQDLYSGLRQFQAIHSDVYAAHNRLQEQSDGDGLWIQEDVAAHWDDLRPSPRWSVSIIPATQQPSFVNVDYEGKSSTGMPSELSNILTDVSKGVLHPSVESYLMLQAATLYEGREPIDKSTYTWLEGNFDLDGTRAAPIGNWRPDYGQVSLLWNEVGDRVGDLGVRPAVRGD